MDNYKKSLLNYFTSSEINRMTDLRRRKDIIDEKLFADNAYFVPVLGTKNLFQNNGRLNPVFPSTLKFNRNIINSDEIIFIGELNGKYYFALPLNEDEETLVSKFSNLGSFEELRMMAPLLNRDEASLLAYARAIVYWRNNHKYCGKCGALTKPVEAGHKRICTNPACGTEHFPRTDPAIIVLVSKNGKCLLARQSRWRAGQYSTIAGFVEPGETLEQAVVREVYEETSVEIQNVKYHSSQPWPFPAALMLGFTAEASTEKIRLLDNELEEAGWFSHEDIINKIKNGTLKFPPPVSVSFRLIEDWFNDNGSVALRDLL